MDYYYIKTLKDENFQGAIQKITDALKEEGFGILSEIDVKETLKKKTGCRLSPIQDPGCL